MYKRLILRTENFKFILIGSFVTMTMIILTSYALTSASYQETKEVNDFTKSISDSLIYIFSPVKILDEIDYEPDT